MTIHDTAAPGPTFDPDQWKWFFAPDRLVVTRGEKVEFYNQGGNDHPHTVTSLERVGNPFASPVQVVAGRVFDSSPTPDKLIQPGGEFVLDTRTLAPGNYTYFCKLHPWMVGEFTVAP